MDKYTVWVGGIEVNDNYLTKKEAYLLYNAFVKAGYDDACVIKVK